MPDSLTSTLTRYYDEVPYESHPFPQSAMEHLEALAYLFGLDAPDPSKARVLELGCAAGGNLIPFAARHPEARAVGVDLSPVQVAQGVAAIERAGLSNIELKVFDISQIDASFGQFDYIVCHGVYSWVPGPVQEAILRICAQNLAHNGVAYVSYNVYPGWKAREIVRDAMILRGGPRDTPEEKLSYARGMLEFLEQSARADSVLKKTLDETMPIVRSANSAYLLHEFLEPCNAPCYFKEFVARADAQGLAYLCDAEPSTMFVQNYGEKVHGPLLRECGGSQILMEQYLDFLVNRTFRQTVLVKQANAAGIRYRLDPARIRELEFAGLFSAEGGGALTLDAREQPCHAIRGLKVTLRLPVHKAVAGLLEANYPASMSPRALIEGASKLTDQPSAAVEPVVMAMLEELLILGALRIRRTPVPAVAAVSEQPRALPAVRSSSALRAGAGHSAGEAFSICNQWHESVVLSLLERSLLPLLDGTHSHEALAEHLEGEVRSDRLRFVKDDKPLTEPSAVKEFSRQQVALALASLRRKALLTA
ncbi:regulatory domain of a methyltransferase-containing protein [Variovorax sp. OK605]|uniref:class I SAM-dependent methyltransferase n=1 Tax=Variovorax sp. OK605 TaxID=1855317 RepID=UPI0008E88276|nr:class I SAM-dependent methyltransferase [Variovorax sp. OK605]SFO75708.1 regulatory domain of a methyltransferase-containing protein [Variovorax sp. OK605]